MTNTQLRTASTSQWRPIETAPKDGTPVLIWQPNGHSFGLRTKCIDTGKLYDDYRYAIGYVRPWNGSWGNRNQADVHPTYWMPLPTPPDEEERSGKLRAR